MKKVMDNLFSRFLYVPWWISAAFGTVLILGFDLALPALKVQDPRLRMLLNAAILIASAIALVALSVAAISLSRYLGYGQWLDAQSANLAYLRTFRWRRYESVLRAVYEKQGFRVNKPRKDTPYASADLLLRKGRNQYLVCARYWRANIVGVKTVHTLFEAMGNRSAAGGIIATCGTFTEEARSFAVGWNIELLDGSKLHNLIYAARAHQLELSAIEAARSELSAGAALEELEQPMQAADSSNVVTLFAGERSAGLRRSQSGERLPNVVGQSR